MANINSKQDANQTFSVYGISGTLGASYGTSETRPLTVSDSGELKTSIGVGSITSNPYYIILDGTTTSNITYVGKASTGANTGSAVWQVSKLDESTNDVLTVTWADGNGSFDNIWTARGTMLFS